MEEMGCIRNDRYRQPVPTGKIHCLGERHNLIGLTMNQQGMLGYRDITETETLDGWTGQNQGIGLTLPLQGRVQLGRDRRAKRKTGKHPLPRKHLGVTRLKLLNQHLHVGGFTLAIVEYACRLANTPKVWTHCHQALLQTSPGNGGHDFIVARSAMQRMGVQDQSPPCRGLFGPFDNTIDHTRTRFEFKCLFTLCHNAVPAVVPVDLFKVALSLANKLNSNPVMSGSRPAMLANLPEPAVLQHQLIEALPAFRHVRWLDETGSTNANLLALAHDASAPTARPWLEGTHLQTMGRGRAGRSWQNRRGANLMFSCAFDVFLPARQLAALSPLTGVATAEALRSLLGPGHQARLAMKWPNDIMWGSAKLAGILVESTRASTARQSADHYVIIVGLGLNLEDARALSLSLDRSVADWSEIMHQDACAATHSVATIVQTIANAWYQVFNEVTRHGIINLAARFSAVDSLLGQYVHILDNGRLLNAGIACGINEHGQLVVKGPDGETALSVGEVSVRARQPLGSANP